MTFWIPTLYLCGGTAFMLWGLADSFYRWYTDELGIRIMQRRREKIKRAKHEQFTKIKWKKAPSWFRVDREE